MPNDAYADVRQLPLRHVFAAVGITTEWKSRKADTEWYGKCCFHEAVKNNTSLSFDAEGKYFCFSCHAKGKGAIDALMRLKRIGFSQSVDFLRSNFGNIIAQQAAKPQIRQVQTEGVHTRLAHENGQNDERKPAPNASLHTQPAENPPYNGTYEKYFHHHDWLTARGLTPETLKHFGVGFYENPKRRSIYGGSVMLRISRYSDGATVGYLSRNIGDITPERPKYSLPKGLQKSLEVFGAWQLKEKRPLRVLVVTESPFAVMKLHQIGIPAVSTFGWSVSDEQAAILSDLARGILYLPDRDKRSEAEAFLGKIGKRMWVKMPELPADVNDAEYLSATQIKALLT